ncbi:MAG: nitroreductase family deazaflavin-dependent oxidoreductase [Ktedonobacteraceae bacterium]|nr:nitroreductase family deazaflavin-dependent oxidoreductase [Ktedonobacteraceae bacterium]MBO0789861.1 nitroreductase family deazaflavin-dependent oxidoreductase [Ktedonobacteraceae bacterium]
MAKTYQRTWWMRMGNVLATMLVRAGVNVGPIHLLTVLGRTTGLPRTTPVAVVEQQRQRYLVATYGLVNWVRNLRAQGEATLTRGRRSETIKAMELPAKEAALVLKACLAGNGRIFQGFFDVTAEASLADFEREAALHPVFALQKIQ